MDLLKIDNIYKQFPLRRPGLFKKRLYAQAVNDVSLSVGEQETLGLVGESGCGKSTLGRTILRLIEPTSGSIVFRGESLMEKTSSQMRIYRKNIQMIFQDPYGSLNPRMTIGRIIEEPLIVHQLAPAAVDRRRRVAELFDLVGIRSGDETKYPGELSGGQRQRVMIARVLATEPQLVIADEPVSALDVSIQSQILNLMRDLMEEFHMSYLFISHDVGVVKFISDRIAVMYLGVIVEIGETNTLLSEPLHPYTQSLLASLPSIHRRGSLGNNLIKGEVPSSVDVPQGCRFHPRCPQAMSICRTTVPQFQTVTQGRQVACHLYLQEAE